VALSEVGISDAANATSTALVAKSITNGVSKAVNIGAAQAAVAVSTLAANLTLGAGKNSLVADTVKGVTITSAGINAFSLKNVSDAAVSATGSGGTYLNITGSAKNSEFKLGEGTNHIDAKGKTLSGWTFPMA
jgi:hypothetical protein